MMNHLLSTTSVLLASAATLAAQCDFGVRTHQLGAPIQAVHQDENNCWWAADLVGDPTKLIAGSFRTNRISVLTTTNPLAVLPVLRAPIVARETGTENHFGVSVEGEWVALRHSEPTLTNWTGESVAAVETATRLHFFSPWHTSWVTEVFRNTTPSVHPGRCFVAAIDGSDSLIAFSALRAPVVERLDVPGSPGISYIVGVGETNVRRNSLAFAIGANELAIYSGYRGWQRLTTASPVSTLAFDFDKNTILITDTARNELTMYSAITGTSRVLAVQDITFVTTAAQDMGVSVVDQISNDVHAFRAVDGGLVSLPGVSNSLTLNQLFNNHLTIAAIDSTSNNLRYSGLSTSTRNAQFVSVTLQTGEQVVVEGGNDCVYVVATDRALYGYSALTNRWTVRLGHQGAARTTNRFEDFIGGFETETHIYVFSPREDRWIERSKNGGTVADGDELMVLTAGTTKAAYGMNANGFRDATVAGTSFLAGVGNSYAFSIHDDDTTGGSHVWFYPSYGDRWLQLPIARRVSVTANVIDMEDGILIVDGDRLHVCSGFGDTSTRWTAPHDNYAYHATPDIRLPVIANGTPGAAAVLALGVSRTQIALPFAACELLIDPTLLVTLPLGAFDPRGILHFELPLQGVRPAVYHLQMVAFGTRGLEFGRLLLQQVF